MHNRQSGVEVVVTFTVVLEADEFPASFAFIENGAVAAVKPVAV
jgi:hypothetical protein